MDAYDLTRKFIETLGDIDALTEKKSHTSSQEEDRLLDTRITALENDMFDIKNKLKSIEI